MIELDMDTCLFVFSLIETIQYCNLVCFSVKQVDKAFTINPKDPVDYNHKCDIFHNINKYDEALKCQDEALKINKKSKIR
jgi:hypothetical protein